MTTYNKKQLQGLTETELAAIAADLKIEIMSPDSISSKDLIDMILTKQNQDEPQLDVAQKHAKSVSDKGTKKVRIIVHNQEGPENTPHVKVGVNDYFAIIPREVEVAVPEFAVEALQAKYTAYDSEGGNPRSVRRHPISVLGPV